MKIIIGSHTNKLNKQHIQRWADFHSQYADKLILVISQSEIEEMKAEINYARSKNTMVIIAHPKVTDYQRHCLCFDVMRFENPDWYGLIPTDEIFNIVPSKEMFEDKETEGYTFDILHLWGSEDVYRTDSFWGVSKTNYIENIRLYKNIFGNVYPVNTGVHTSLFPIEMKKSKKIMISNMSILHYAFVDPTQWDKRVKAYGEEYAKGGGHDGYDELCAPSLEPIKKEMVFA